MSKLEKAHALGKSKAREVLEQIHQEMEEFSEPFSADEKYMFWVAFNNEIGNE